MTVFDPFLPPNRHQIRHRNFIEEWLQAPLSKIDCEKQRKRPRDGGLSVAGSIAGPVSGAGSSLAHRHWAVLVAQGRERPVIGGGDGGSGTELVDRSSLRGIVGVLVKLGIRSHLLEPYRLGRVRHGGGSLPGRNLALCRVSMHTGLRQAEQFGLRWENIDTISRVPTIPLPKSGETRHVSLNDIALAILRGLKARQVVLSPWVFPSPVDASKSRDACAFYRRVFVPAVGRAGLSGVVWHTLRHAFCSRLVQAGIPLTTVQKLAGHKDYSTTLMYDHLSPGHLHEAVGTLRGKIRKKNPNRHQIRHRRKS